MCFSVQVDVDIKKLAKYFSAEIDTKAYANFMAQREREKVTPVDELKNAFGLKRKPSSELFKIPAEDNRIFPGYFTHVMTLKNGNRTFEPMRYRVRPHGSKEEVPSKFNVFNARLDGLEKRKTWSPLFMRNHGVFGFSKFYEWVWKTESSGPKDLTKTKKLISFLPHEREIMWAPCLWDEWKSTDGKFSFKSFAIITDEPPKEVEEMGHDRCPIFLKEDYLNDWLNPSSESKEEIYEMLQQKEAVTFDHQWVEND